MRYLQIDDLGPIKLKLSMWMPPLYVNYCRYASALIRNVQ